jgi:hypothetical protein
MTLEDRLNLFVQAGWTCNPETGDTFRPNNKLETNLSGKIAHKYIQCSMRVGPRNLDKKEGVKAHQLLWFIYKNEVSDQIDHINRNTLDNRLVNLRNVNQNQNQWNRSNTKGYTKVRNKYRACIRCNGKRINIGYFDTEELARQAYLEYKSKYHVI